MKLIAICCVVVATAAIAKASESSAIENFLQEIVPKNFKISDYFELTKNDYQNNEIKGRSESSIESSVEDYMKSHDATFKLPIIGSTVTFTARNLDNDEIDLKVKFGDGDNQVEARRNKKKKLKKIFIPIFIFIIIKAMVMIPLALGVLAIKTWNALQLSFVSFIIALSLGVWQLCKKIAGDNAHPHIVAHHDPWAASQYAARSYDEADEAQKLAYKAHIQ